MAFANTLRSDRAGRDALATWDQARRWLTDHGLPPDGALDLPTIDALRATIRAAFDQTIRGDALAPNTIDTINAAASLAPVVSVLELHDGRLEITLRRIANNARDSAVAAIATSAMEVLGSASMLRACDGPGCRLYFVGGPHRRWCSSKVCGNRVRVAAFAARKRMGMASAEPTPGSPHE